jgi:hypothetical protein
MKPSTVTFQALAENLEAVSVSLTLTVGEWHAILAMGKELQALREAANKSPPERAAQLAVDLREAASSDMLALIGNGSLSKMVALLKDIGSRACQGGMCDNLAISCHMCDPCRARDALGRKGPMQPLEYKRGE